MFNQIYNMFMEKYSGLTEDEIKKALRADGLDGLVDMMENDPFYAKIHSEMMAKVMHEIGDTGVIASPLEEIAITPIDFGETFCFDEGECMRSCSGNCCKSRNYLMISIQDIFNIVSSPAAKLMNIASTKDLFKKDKPLIELFFDEKYGVFLPYIRFLPVGADADTRPEDAPESICPFLYPIEKVYSFHNKELPKNCGAEAMGCILMKNKPSICRLSPVGRAVGMVTGRISYETAPPSLECPACNTDIEVDLSNYLQGVEQPGEREQQQIFTQIMGTQNKVLSSSEQQRFDKILKKMYNFDELLFEMGLSPEYRPPVHVILEAVVTARNGDFSVYQELVENLKGASEHIN